MNTLNLELSKLNNKIKENSLFNNMFSLLDTLAFENKKSIMIKLFYTISLVSLSLPISNYYIESKLNNNLIENNKSINKEQNLIQLYENYKNSLENDGLFNLSNKISTNLSNLIFEINQETSSDRYFKSIQSILTTSYDGKSIKEKIDNIENEKNDIIKFHNVSPTSSDFKKINEMFNIEKESLLKQMNIIESYNQKIIDTKNLKNLNFENIIF